jgi:hypothetical protein
MAAPTIAQTCRASAGPVIHGRRLRAQRAEGGRNHDRSAGN